MPKGTIVRTDRNSHLWEQSVGTADRVRLEGSQALRVPPRNHGLLSRGKRSVTLSCSIWRCVQQRALWHFPPPLQDTCLNHYGFCHSSWYVSDTWYLFTWQMLKKKICSLKNTFAPVYSDWLRNLESLDDNWFSCVLQSDLRLFKEFCQRPHLDSKG